MKKNKNKMMKIESKVGILFICAAILFLCFAGTVSAKTCYVPDDHSTIQAAVDAVDASDTIIVRDGIYTENVDVNKRLTLRSENGADSTIVQAAKSDDHVFSVTVDHVSISGFTVKGANGPYCPAGIHLYYAENCNISNNYASNNGEGIRLLDSPNCTITGNNASNNGNGISLDFSSSNMIANNNANSNSYSGILLRRSSNNKIYLNNFIDNIHNVYSLESTNIWNSTSMITYIYNEVTYENYRGNYWSDYNGTDTNNDGIGDTPYSIDSDKDNYPLMNYFEIYFTEIKPTPPTPGFEAIFAIAGLLVVAHLLRRKK